MISKTAFAVLSVVLLSIALYRLIRMLILTENKRKRILAAALILTSGFLLTFFIYLFIDTVATRVNLPFMILFAVMPALLYVILIMRQIYSYREELLEYKERTRKDTERYELIQSFYEKNARNYHELNHHLRAIRDLAEAERSGDIISYIDEIDILPAKDTNRVYTGVDIIDTILSEAVRSGKEKNIEVHIDSDMIPARGRVIVSDYCSLFSNLVDNALESAKSMVRLRIRLANHMLFIHMENDCRTRPRIENGNMRTTKNDPLRHGFGQKIIRTICGKYDGTAQFSVKDDLFTADIILSL
ncbi:MAG: GHKL domain-containing protein [Lachnospiraceae bacterium]|nr:GHKL domain-containing protein [Lachnospiraceae bacterium]